MKQPELTDLVERVIAQMGEELVQNAGHRLTDALIEGLCVRLRVFAHHHLVNTKPQPPQIPDLPPPAGAQHTTQHATQTDTHTDTHTDTTPAA